MLHWLQSARDDARAFLVTLATLVALLGFGSAACDSRTQRPQKPGASDDPSGAAPPSSEHIRWRKTVPVADGGGRRGPWRMNDSEFFYVDDPAVDIGADGTIGVAWVDNRDQNVFFQMYAPDGTALLEAPVLVSRSPEIFSWLPRVAVDGPDAEQIYILWQEIVFSGGSHGGEIFFARSTDGGRTFTPPKNLSTTQNGAGKGRLTREIWDNGSLDLAVDGDGDLHVAWTEYQGRLRYRRSTDGGDSFESARTIAGTDRAPARGPSIATGPGDRVYLAWTLGEVSEADIRIARSTDGGTQFESPRTPLQTGGASDAPKMTVDSNGQLHLVFAESPEGRFQRYHVRYARAPAGDLTFETSRRLSSPETPAGHFPHIEADSDDRLYVVWERYPDPSGPPRGLRVATSTDGGMTFSSPSTIPRTAANGRAINGSLQGKLMQKLAVGPDGAVAVVNSRFDAGEASRVFLHLGHWPRP